MVKRFWFKLILKGIGLTIIVYILICLGLYTYQTRLIFAPSKEIKATPENRGLAFEEVWIAVLTREKKIERLNAWWIPAKSSNKDVLLYLHGKGGNISANLNQAEYFHNLGFSVLLIDYRGYGRSEGKFPSEAEVYRDAQAAWDYLTQKRQINPRQIFFFFHSLGGAIALDLAVRQPRAAGVIIESSFTSMLDAVNSQKLYHIFPINWLLTQRFDSLAKLRLLKIPVLYIHGKKDSLIPYHMSHTLYKNTQGVKRLLLVANAEHHNVARVNPQKYFQATANFSEGLSSSGRIKIISPI